MLAAKRADTQNELTLAQATRQEHLLAGDISDHAIGSQLQLRVDTATSALAGLDEAISSLTAHLDAAERDLAEEKKRAAHKAAGEALAREIGLIEKLVGPWLQSTHLLADDLQKYATLRFDAGAIANYLKNAAGEAEIALAVCIADLRAAAMAISEGREKIPEVPPPPEPVQVVAPPTTERVFLINPIAWTSEDGTRRRAPRNDFVSLSPNHAARARERRATIPLTDPRVKTLRVQSQPMPEWHHCIDLDNVEPSTAEPVKHSAFEKVDRGPAYTIRVPREVTS